MLSWMITIFVAQCLLLGLMGWFVLRSCQKRGKDDEAAPLSSNDGQRIRELLEIAGFALSDHADKLAAFEQSMQEANRNGKPPSSLGVQIGEIRQANHRVEQAVETTLDQLVASCGALLSDQQARLQSYQQKTQAFDSSLEIEHDDKLVQLASTLLGMIGELRTENKAARQEVAAGQRKIERLLDRSRSAEQLARVDALTQLPNRRAFDEKLDSCDAALRRYDQPYCLIMIDIDLFKSVNDRFGHATGDAVLTLIGRILRESCRPGDHASRLGGEEFAILLSQCELESARLIAERFRHKVKAAVLRNQNQPVSVTVSCGVAQAVAGESKGQLLDRADAALYEAKQQGRNRTCADQAVDAPTPDSAVASASR